MAPGIRHLTTNQEIPGSRPGRVDRTLNIVEMKDEYFSLLCQSVRVALC